MMKYCKKCLQPDTRPNEKFINGVCSICRYYDSVEDIDVVERLSLQVGVVPENEEYLEAKRLVKGHFISK